jgi:hypothetical protein
MQFKVVRINRNKIWMRHKVSGKYMTHIGLMSSMQIGDSHMIAGYVSEGRARGALTQCGALERAGIVWEDLEVVTSCGE